MTKKQTLSIPAFLLFCASFAPFAAAQKPSSPPPPPAAAAVAGQEKAVPSINGEFKDNTYTNHAFGFSFSFPSGKWVMQPPELNAEDMQIAKDVMKTGDAAKDKKIEKLLEKDRIVAGISNETDDPKEMVEVSVTVKKLPPIPGPLKAATEATIKIMTTMNLKFTAGPVKVITLAGAETSVFDGETEMEGIKVKQKIYTLRHKGHYINVVFSFLEKETGERMADVMNTLKLK